MDEDNRDSFRLIVGGVWPIEPVEDRPEVWLSDWRVYEIVQPTADPAMRHLVGWAMRAGQGQVSSAIRYIDPVTRCCVTQSGRAYYLHGKPGLSEDARYVWGVWKRLNRVDDTRDVTDELTALFEAAGRQR